MIKPTGSTPREGKTVKKTTLHFAADFHKRVRIAAIEEGMTMSALIEWAVEQYLAQRKKGK